MNSEVEITETPNWLKELEAKRERRLKTKLGHELGAGAPCLTCEEKCPGLDLHFWRKICKNCKCSKENHEVQDDDIYGWAQDELLGTKVNRLKRKIVLPGRKDEVELEWTPTGQKDTIDKYLKTLPTELLPIKGSQAAQDRKQLLKKQIPLHDIDPTLCHELTDEELRKMQEYVAHIRESSAGVGHLIQVNFSKGIGHVFNQNDAMFLINNVPKGVVSSENVILQEGNNSVPFNNLTNQFGSVDVKDKHDLSNQEPNMVSLNEIDEQNPIYTNIRNKHYMTNDLINKNNENNSRTGKQNIYNPQETKILKEDVQTPLDTSLRSLNYPSNILDESETSSTPEFDSNKFKNRLYENSNIKNLVPSAFVPIKYSKDICNETNNSNTSDMKVKELPYPSQFINDQLNSLKNLHNYNQLTHGVFDEHQNPAFFEPIKDIRYSPNQNMHYNRDTDYSNAPYATNNETLGSYPLPPGIPASNNLYRPLEGSNKGNKDDNHSQGQGTYYLDESGHAMLNYRPGSGGGIVGGASSEPVHNLQNPQQFMSNYPGNNEDDSVLGKFNQTNSPIPHLAHRQTKLYEDQQKPATIKSIRDLAYSTYDCPPHPLLEDDFHNLSVKDRLNMIKKGELPQYQPSNSSISDDKISPTKYSMMDQKKSHNNKESGNSLHPERPEALHSIREYVTSPFIQNSQLEDSNSQNPSLQGRLASPNTGYVTNQPKNGSYIRTIPTEGSEGAVKSLKDGQQLPIYAAGKNNVYEDDVQPMYIPIGGIHDIEYQDPDIRTALSKDNELFEGSAPNKFIPDLTAMSLPCCHYCKEEFKQDELAIAIPERSDAIFHTDCFKCHGCNQILADMFYFYDKETDNIYCGRDYAKIRGIPRCKACDELIFVKEYCLAENCTFHVKHFCCFECDKPLAGQNYVMENDQPLCVPCYELTKANKCYACKEVIHPDQQGLQLKDGVHFHATEDCFACKICKKSLFGAKLLFRKDCLYCSHDCYNSDV